MAQISGWIFVVIGAVVTTWSLFDYSLRFFIIVGGLLIIYGIGKVVYARLHSPQEHTESGHAQAAPHRPTTGSRQYVPQRMQQAQHSAQANHTMLHAHQAHTHPHHAAQPHVPHAQHAAHPSSRPAVHQPLPSQPMRLCPQCKKQIAAAYRFCPNCGWGV